MQRFNKKFKQLTARAARAFCGSSSDDGRERAIAVSNSKQQGLLAGMRERCRQAGRLGCRAGCVASRKQQAAASKAAAALDDIIDMCTGGL